MKHVIVHIDSLVLRGFAHEHQWAIALGLQEELTKLFSDKHTAGQLAAQGNMSRLRTDSIFIDQGSKPLHIGTEAARGIGREIKK